jgi:hypothetical protein
MVDGMSNLSTGRGPLIKRVQVDEFTIEEIRHSMFYQNEEDDTCGFSFECDENGIVDVERLSPEGLANYKKCIKGEGVRPGKLESNSFFVKLCRCGSGFDQRELNDARGIFCCYVCPDCEEEKRRKYRADIFENPNYWTDEVIEPEDCY